MATTYMVGRVVVIDEEIQFDGHRHILLKIGVFFVWAPDRAVPGGVYGELYNLKLTAS